MKIKEPKIYILVEIDQSRYLGDEDYTGLEKEKITDREKLGNLLDSGYYDVRIKRLEDCQTEF